MLDAYIIDKIRRRGEEESEKKGNRLTIEVPYYSPELEEEKPEESEKPSEDGCVDITDCFKLKISGILGA